MGTRVMARLGKKHEKLKNSFPPLLNIFSTIRTYREIKILVILNT